MVSEGNALRKSIIAVIAAVLVAVLITSYAVGTLYFSPAPSSETGALNKLGTFEQGTLYQTAGEAGKFFVVNLHGSFHEMGRQYGYLLKNQLNEFYAAATQQLLNSNQNITQEALNEVAKSGYQTQPNYLQDLIRGMSETSGMPLQQQKVSASLFGFLFGCSSIDAWGNYSTDGSVVVGRNWDTERGVFDGYAKYLTVVVYNPVGYASSIAEINYVGCVGFQSGMNSHGIFLDLQNGQLADTAVYGERTPGAFLLFDFLLNSTTLNQVDKLFQTTQPNMGLIINAANAEKATVYEWATYDTKTRTSADGLVASSNHFLNSSWTGLQAVPVGVHGGFSKERQKNLMNLGEQNKGSIDAAKMMEILDTTIPNGGPTFPDDSVYETYYHIVGVPRELTVWLKAPGYSGWEQIDLKSLFVEL